MRAVVVDFVAVVVANWCPVDNVVLADNLLLFLPTTWLLLRLLSLLLLFDYSVTLLLMLRFLPLVMLLMEVHTIAFLLR